MTLLGLGLTEGGNLLRYGQKVLSNKQKRAKSDTDVVNEWLPKALEYFGSGFATFQLSTITTIL